MELLVLFGLFILNGLFAMSELAVVSARKARLQSLADAGDSQAKAAIKLIQEPDQFLSTIQIGITLIGIFAGAFGGSALAGDLAEILRDVLPSLGATADTIGLILIVLLTTYLSLVIGELVPKRLALRNAEGIARRVARPMGILARFTRPVVWILTQSSNLILRLMGIREMQPPPVSEMEVITMIRDGVNAGIFGQSEDEMVQGVLRLDERRIGSIITPRTETVWLDINDSEDVIREKIIESPYSAYPVARGSMDDIVGIVRSKDLLAQLIKEGALDLITVMIKPHFIPESVTVFDALEHFKRSGIHTALIVGEYGGIEGLVRMHDIIELIFGELDVEQIDAHDPDMRRREDGSWLLGGQVSMEQLEELYPNVNFPDNDNYETLAGFVMAQLREVPEEADHFNFDRLIFEVVDMDGVRVDKVLVREKE